MTDKAPAHKEPAIGDPVPMPADEQVAENIERVSGRSAVPKTVPLTKELVDEKKNAKPADSKDEVVTDSNAGPAPAGYDEHGQTLKTEEERRLAGAPTSEAQQKLADKLSDIDRKANDERDAAKKATESSVSDKRETGGGCQTCKHTSSEHPNGKSCTHSTATLECDCKAFVAPS